MELKMTHQLIVEKMSTKYITTIISILNRKFKSILKRMKFIIQQKEISIIFLMIQLNTYMHQSISHFLPKYIRHLPFATKFLVSLNNLVPQHIHGFTQNRKVNNYFNVRFAPPLPLEFFASFFAKYTINTSWPPRSRTKFLRNLFAKEKIPSL